MRKKTRLQKKNRHQGLTLVELLVTIALVAIVTAFAVPNFSTFIRDGRTTADFNRLLGDITFARSEAVTRGSFVSLCPSQNFTSCNGVNWSDGWIAFVDDGAGSGTAGNRSRDGSEFILRVGESTRGKVSITATNFTAPDPDNSAVLFSPDGKIENGQVANIGQFTICDDQGNEEKAKGITFSVFGQSRQMRDTDNSGVVDWGSPPNDVSC